MTERVLRICNSRGLHARAAAKFVRTAEAYNAELIVTKDGQSVVGTSIMGLMMLSASKGTEIHVSSTGPQADGVLNEITILVEAGFHEED